MKSTTLAKRFAATGVATALAAGALVGAGSTAAQAAPEVTNDYVCSSSGGLIFGASLSTNAVGIEGFPTIGAGAMVPAGLLTVTNRATMPGAAAQALGGSGIDRLEVTDFAADFGGNPVGTTGMVGLVSNIEDNGDGTVSLDLPKDDPDTFGIEGALNEAFVVPAAGQYSILMPQSFHIDAYAGETLATVIACELADGETAEALHNIEVTKNNSTVAAKAPKKVKKGKAAKVVATVTGAQLAGDKVLLKRGKKTVASAKLNDAGKAVLKTKKLKPGKNKLTVVYKATGYNNASKSDPFVVKVAR